MRQCADLGEPEPRYIHPLAHGLATERRRPHKEKFPAKVSRQARAARPSGLLSLDRLGRAPQTVRDHWGARSAGMDRQLLQRHLAQTEVRIEHGKALMTQQLRTMLRSDHGSRDYADARRRLRLFENSVAVHIADRIRLSRELKTSQGH